MKIENRKEVKNLEKEVRAILEKDCSKSLKMKELFELGLDIKNISQLMNVRYNFVYNVISNHVNINEIDVVKESRDSKKDEIIKLFLENKTNVEISKMLKTNYNYIYKTIKEYKQENERKVVNK